MSLVAFFLLSFFPRDVLDEIWDLTESVSEGIPTYSFNAFKVYVLLPHVFLTHHSNADVGAGYTFYPLSVATFSLTGP